MPVCGTDSLHEFHFSNTQRKAKIPIQCKPIAEASLQSVVTSLVFTAAAHSCEVKEAEHTSLQPPVHTLRLELALHVCLYIMKAQRKKKKSLCPNSYSCPRVSESCCRWCREAARRSVYSVRLLCAAPLQTRLRLSAGSRRSSRPVPVHTIQTINTAVFRNKNTQAHARNVAEGRAGWIGLPAFRAGFFFFLSFSFFLLFETSGIPQQQE